MKKPIALSALILVGGLALVGCTAKVDPIPTETETPIPVGSEQGSLRWYAVELPEKQAVDCVASQYHANVIHPTCDWANVYSFSGDFKGDSGSLKSYTVKAEGGREIICVASRYHANVIDPDCNWSLESNR